MRRYMSRSLASKRRERGVTPLELAGSLGILAAVAITGSWFLGHSRESDRARSAERAAERIYGAADQWQQDNPGECPTLSQLMYDNRLERDALVEDPWGSRYRVVCEGELLTVLSSGQDGRVDTADDIRIPES